METELKDALRLYIGCECTIKPFEIEYKAKFLGLIYPFVYVQTGGDKAPTKYRIDKVGFIPILRPLSDINDDERRLFASIAYKPGSVYHKICLTSDVIYKDRVGFILKSKSGEPDEQWQYLKCWQYQTIWLLQQNFDLFGLIESGQAVDKTKLL